MESRDREIVLQVMNSDVELKRLYDRHLELEEYLLQYNSRLFLTADEEMETKRLKKEKLQGVDRMMQIINPHRSMDSVMHA